jgi:DNA-binding NarL/FixJ family response regulator
MSDELYRLLLIDSDRIFRMGMRSWLAQFSDLEVVAEVDTAETALEYLSDDAIDIDLILLDLNLEERDSEVSNGYLSGLELCQQLKSRYPDLPILLLSSPQPTELVAIALRTGVEGYCLKGTKPEELIIAIRQVASGEIYLGDRDNPQINQSQQLFTNLPNEPVSVVAIIRHNFYLSGLRRIDRALGEVKASLEGANPQQISDHFAQLVLAGQVRELQAARWLIHQLWKPAKRPHMLSQSNDVSPTNLASDLSVEVANPQVEISSITKESNILAIQASLWDRTVEKLQASLVNLSRTPLEIDILKDEKKRELLYIALRQVEQSLTELRFSEIQPNQLHDQIPTILKNIWQETVINFFGKYYSLSHTLNTSEVNVVDVLLKDVAIVQAAFLNKIPQIENFLSHLLFETELIVNNANLAIGTPEAMQRAELILDNLLIQIANGVIQPLLNHFADVEEVKHKFYRYNLLPTREIERFRNDLSWKYRLEKYITDPQLIFESRQVLFAFANSGIKQVSIYAPRSQELQQLEGIQLAVTLVLELQDAIAPRLKSAIAFLGSGFVYVLTNVIGRGIGLIGRGVLQGIGTAWQESRPRNKK